MIHSDTNRLRRCNGQLTTSSALSSNFAQPMLDISAILCFVLTNKDSYILDKTKKDHILQLCILSIFNTIEVAEPESSSKVDFKRSNNKKFLIKQTYEGILKMTNRTGSNLQRCKEKFSGC